MGSQASDLEPGTPPALLERERELEAIRESIGAARAGYGSTLVLEGEAGIGKSALIACASQLAAAAGMRVLDARGWERERELPFGIVRQLLEPVLSTATAPQRKRLLAGAARLAAPALALGPPQRPGGGDPSGGLHGLYWLVSNLASEQPLLISIDDAHWADAASVDFVSYLARRVRELPALIVYSARPHEGAQNNLPDATEPELVNAVLQPAGLSETAVTELVERVLGRRSSPRFVSACHTASTGNPFLLRELLREVQAMGIEPDDAGAEHVVQLAPRAISRATLARLARLGEPVTRLAMAVAVLGARAELRHAAALAEIELDVAGIAADALLAAGILRRARPLEFVHPVVGTTVYEAIAPARRAAGHRRAALLYEQEATTPDMIAPHLLATEPANDAWVVERLREAAAAALACGAPQAAARHLRRALQEPPAAGVRAQVLLELGTAAARAGEAGAGQYLDAAHELAQDAPTKTVVALELAQARIFGGDLRGAVELLEGTLERLGAGHPELAGIVEEALFVTAQMNPATSALIAHRVDDAKRAWRRADTELPPAVLSIVAIESIASGTAADAVELAQRALGEGRMVANHSADSAAVYFATCALTLADRPKIAEQHLDCALADARARGSQRGYATASCFRAFTRYRAGDVRGAEADAQAALELADDPGLAVLRPVLAATLTDCMLARGEIEQADAMLARVCVDVIDPDSAFTQLLRESIARLRIAQRRPGDALVQLRACQEWAMRSRVTRPAWISWRSTSALAHEALGEHERAVLLAHEEIGLARGFGGHGSIAVALRTAGLLAGGERGVELLRAAAAQSERSGALLVQAETLTALGAAMRRSGRPRDARVPLKEALHLAHRCGADGVAERAREELTAAGGRPRRIAISGVESLTTSERRVAQLAAQGLANREIAQALFVTVRTVESHLTQAYQKLDIASREQLAGAFDGSDR